MKIYTLLAWLPGEPVFYAKNQDGAIGLLAPNGFIQAPDHYVNSAILKWGFMDLRGLKLQADPGHLVQVSNHLASL